MDIDPNLHNKAACHQPHARRAAIPFDSRRRANYQRPPVSREAKSSVPYPGFWHRGLRDAVPVLLLAIALLCTLFPGLLRKWIATTAKHEIESQAESTSRRALAAPSSAKPSPASPATISRAELSTTPGRPAHAVSILPGHATLADRPLQYKATHTKALGGCTGQLELTSAALHFRCSHQADLVIPVSFIAATHKDGVVLASGEKYHFLIANQSKGQVEMIFSLWLNRARQSRQATDESAF